MDKRLSAKVYTKEITSEVPKPTSYRCFNGAWYYKALSSRDNWLGIVATITLPVFHPDEERFDMIPDNLDPSKLIKRYKDTPSVYVGVSSDYETDIGFAWQRGLVNGVVGEEKITFRPFWRYIYKEDGKEKNIYDGVKLNETEYYYFPGDTVKITVATTRPNYLKFRCELVKETTIDKYQEIRKKLDKAPKVFETLEFIAPGNGINKAEVKRVNAIDQYGNEGKPTQMTGAIVEACTWRDVYLFREIDGNIVKVPFDESRYIRMLCPKEDAFTYTLDGNTETIIINPKREDL